MSKYKPDYFDTFLNYDKETGIFTWKERPRTAFKHKHHWVSWNNRCSGKVAGSVVKKKNKTYLNFSINGKRFYSHRVAWFMSYGRLPIGEIDHINGDSTDNSIANLREVDRGDNCRNMKTRKDSSSGYSGVTWYKPYEKWRARTMFEGKEYLCGYFGDLEEAIEAVKTKRLELGFHSNHGAIKNG